MVGLEDSVRVPLPVPVLEAVLELLPVVLAVAAAEAVAEAQAAAREGLAEAQTEALGAACVPLLLWLPLPLCISLLLVQGEALGLCEAGGLRERE
jgi:hypothetical protein